MEPLGEPAVGRGEQVTPLGPPVLPAPQPGQARRAAQLPRPRALLPGDRDGASEADLGRSLVRLGKGQQQLPPEPVQLGLEPAPPGPLGSVQGVVQEVQAGDGPARPRMSLGEQGQEVGRPELRPRGRIIPLNL